VPVTEAGRTGRPGFSWPKPQRSYCSRQGPRGNLRRDLSTPTPTAFRDIFSTHRRDRKFTSLATGGRGPMQSENKSPEYWRQPGTCSTLTFASPLSVGYCNHFSALKIRGDDMTYCSCQKFCCARKKSLNGSGAGPWTRTHQGFNHPHPSI
jgi:hypothetical protein